MSRTYRRLMRNCWRKRRYHSLAFVARVAPRAAAREGCTIYVYECPFGDHFHLTKHPSFGGRELAVAALPPRRGLDKSKEPS